jgi:molybdopterin-containing oxidoreductase family molybdopterin binding subunit
LQLSRRRFVQVGAGAAALLGAGAAGALAFEDWLVSAEAEDQDDEQLRYMWHTSGCNGACSLKCTVREGHIAMLEPNDTEAITDESVCCVRGLSEIENVYSPDRIQTPMKRVGERGSGEFVAISWDEALDTIEQQFKEIQSKYGPDSILYFDLQSLQGRYGSLAAMVGMQVVRNYGIDIGIENGYHPAFNAPDRYMGTNEFSDAINSATLLIVGSNSLESNIACSWQWFDVLESGTTIITVDPNYTTTAQKSNQWIPIKHGTDAALFLGMITAILDNGWYDTEFMLAHTSFPFLVNEADGLMVRSQVPDPGDEASLSGKTNPFYVWDTVSNSPKPSDQEGIVPLLEGSFTHEGKRYLTAFSLLKAKQEDYTLQWAAETTDIPASTIEDLARQYATAGPAFIICAWGGPDKYSNADVSGHAMAVLLGLTGNLGKPGAGFSNGGFYMYLAEALFLLPWMIPQTYPGIGIGPDCIDLPVKGTGYKAIFAAGNPFQQQMPDTNATREWLEGVEFIALAEVYNSASVQYADIVLPVCSYFECEDEIGALSIVKDRLMVRQKVIEPLFESHTDFWIQKQLCARFGNEDDLPESLEALARYQLATAFNPVVAQITLEELLEKQCAMTLTGAMPRPNRLLEDQVYTTPSGRLEPYYEQFIDDGQAYPSFELPQIVNDDNPLKAEFPLIYNNIKSKYRAQSRFYFAKWINQYLIPELEMAPGDASERGIEAGDTVEVFNDRGSFKLRARVNPSIRPGSLRSDQGIPPALMIEGLIGNVIKNPRVARSSKFRFGPPACYNDNLVEVRKAGDTL